MYELCKNPNVLATFYSSCIFIEIPPLSSSPYSKYSSSNLVHQDLKTFLPQVQKLLEHFFRFWTCDFLWNSLFKKSSQNPSFKLSVDHLPSFWKAVIKVESNFWLNSHFQLKKLRHFCVLEKGYAVMLYT